MKILDEIFIYFGWKSRPVDLTKKRKCSICNRHYFGKFVNHIDICVTSLSSKQLSRLQDLDYH